MDPGEKEEGVRGYDGKAGKWDSHRLCVCMCAHVCVWESGMHSSHLTLPLPAPALTLWLH